jgi:hypothetical protein
MTERPSSVGLRLLFMSPKSGASSYDSHTLAPSHLMLYSQSKLLAPLAHGYCHFTNVDNKAWRVESTPQSHTVVCRETGSKCKCVTVTAVCLHTATWNVTPSAGWSRVLLGRCCHDPCCTDRKQKSGQPRSVQAQRQSLCLSKLTLGSQQPLWLCAWLLLLLLQPSCRARLPGMPQPAHCMALWTFRVKLSKQQPFRDC